MSKASIPKGTRDFLPEESGRRKYMFNIIEDIFKRYAYLPIETPAMERMETLTGKYGEEGDRLIFKILNSGDFWREFTSACTHSEDQNSLVDFASLDSHKIASHISEKALRYDLTVPFARFIVQHQSEIVFPFKRYQIQPVWRADKPQKGRYREFYQCDVDVIGSPSLLNEVEMIRIIDDVFSRLFSGIPSPAVTIKLNNRKILNGLAQYFDISHGFAGFVSILDKSDKTGLDIAWTGLKAMGVSQRKINELHALLSHPPAYNQHIEDMQHKVNVLTSCFAECNSEAGFNGLEELKKILSCLPSLQNSRLTFDITLARGLDYYTGSIMEVTAGNYPGSICGGGRYDNLTGIFGLPDVSGVGISFGADRIYDIMKENALFPPSASTAASLMFANFGEKETAYCFPLLYELRNSGIPAELYPDAVKIKKQMKYAHLKAIPLVALAGENEIQNEELKIKVMKTGDHLHIKKSDFCHTVIKLLKQKA